MGLSRKFVELLELIYGNYIVYSEKLKQGYIQVFDKRNIYAGQC